MIPVCVHFERLDTSSRTYIQIVKYSGSVQHVCIQIYKHLVHLAHVLIYRMTVTCLNRKIHSQEEQHVGISHVVSFWECEANTHTVTRFRLFSPISFIYWFPNGALSNGYSLVACFRGMEFTVRVSGSERARSRESEKESCMGERGRASEWREGLREVISSSGYGLKVERCWRNKGKIVFV